MSARCQRLESSVTAMGEGMDPLGKQSHALKGVKMFDMATGHAPSIVWYSTWAIHKQVCIRCPLMQALITRRMCLLSVQLGRNRQWRSCPRVGHDGSIVRGFLIPTPPLLAVALRCHPNIPLITFLPEGSRWCCGRPAVCMQVGLDTISQAALVARIGLGCQLLVRW